MAPSGRRWSLRPTRWPTGWRPARRSCAQPSGGYLRGCGPGPKAVVWVVGFDADTGAAVAGLRTTHPGFSMVTGVVQSGKHLWLGSIGAPYLGRVDVEDVTL